MKYPRIKPKLDRRRIFTASQLKKIKNLYRNGFRTGTIARLLNAHHSTIKYIVDPGYRLRRIRDAYEATKRKRLIPEWNKRNKLTSNLSHKRKRKMMPEETAYDKFQMQKFKKKHPDYFKNWNKKHRKTLTATL